MNYTNYTCNTLVLPILPFLYIHKHTISHIVHSFSLIILNITLLPPFYINCTLLHLSFPLSLPFSSFFTFLKFPRITPPTLPPGSKSSSIHFSILVSISSMKRFFFCSNVSFLFHLYNLFLSLS